MKIRIKILKLILSICIFASIFCFTANAYTITYIKDKVSKEVFTPIDYGTYRSSYKDAYGNEVFMLTDDIPYIEGYNFLGWKIGDSSEILYGGKAIKANSDLTVTGQFSIGHCDVKYEGSHKEDFYEEVTTGRDYRVREPGPYYGRDFWHYEMRETATDKLIRYINPMEVVPITCHVTFKAVWHPYQNIFAKKLSINSFPWLSLYYSNNAPFLKMSQSNLDSHLTYDLYNICSEAAIINVEYTNNPDEAITDIRLFEGTSYSGSTSTVLNGKTYIFATLPNGVPYNIRNPKGFFGINKFSGEPLYVGYTTDPSSDEKIMGASIMTKSYPSTGLSRDSAYYHNIVKDQNGNEKNILSGTLYYGATIPGMRKNYIVFDRYDITKFIADYDVYEYKSVVGKNWMKKIPDDYYVTEINIPGSHDSGALKANWLITQGATQTQDKPVYEQLENGCRYLDVRPFYTRDRLLNIHGECDLKYDTSEKTGPVHDIDKRLGRNRDNYEFLKFEDMLYWAIKFVTDNPTETILFSVQSDRDYNQKTVERVRAEIEDMMYGYYENDKSECEPGRVWIENRVPTMKEARGKVIILNSWWHSDVPYKNIAYGVDFVRWGDLSPRSSDFISGRCDGGSQKSEYVIKNNIMPYLSAVENGGDVAMENTSNKAHIDAGNYIWKLAEQPNKIVPKFYFLNTQVRKWGGGWPSNYYKEVYDAIQAYNFTPGLYYGTIVFDFFSSPDGYKIYSINFPYLNWG